MEEEFEKVIGSYDQVVKEYQEAQQFIVENIQNKENTIKEVQKEFDKVNFFIIPVRREN